MSDATTEVQCEIESSSVNSVPMSPLRSRHNSNNNPELTSDNGTGQTFQLYNHKEENTPSRELSSPSGTIDHNKRKNGMSRSFCNNEIKNHIIKQLLEKDAQGNGDDATRSFIAEPRGENLAIRHS